MYCHTEWSSLHSAMTVKNSRSWVLLNWTLNKTYFVFSQLLSTLSLPCFYILLSSSSFSLAVTMHKCWRQRSCMNSIFSIAMLNKTCCIHSAITMENFLNSVFKLNYYIIFYRTCFGEIGTELNVKHGYWYIFL